jgi:hypothetical protein
MPDPDQLQGSTASTSEDRFSDMSEDHETTEMLELATSLASVSGAGFDKLTDKQRRFAALYVLQGGNGKKAAELAGYASPDVDCVRVRLNPKVAELIHLLALADARATLPVAIAVLLDIATGFDEDADGKRIYRANPMERRKAALDLARIGGALQSQQGPSVAVQVNNPQPSGDASPSSVSVVIRNVWDRRSARMSGIAAPMLDSVTTIDGTAHELAGDAGEGGVRPQGPPVP